ncbi:VOC family protein [Aquimarina brevivitae]|uniref:Catechol 2,3-dioxygenase-like lactoylglutathione lyase family enzyme n=1 Tax=Aquimarina brevivitae TaxID=323412 RepID=A0A4Q7P156_9FLAO|nr:VOC family protein [Aquimarina brevivitae]RZS93556.1 catechol 2,3-dioxygenase-like lactoylglutathione lyase family enzyme [Aquimarina brevivitae]
MKTQNLNRILKGVLLAYVALITGCTAENPDAEVLQKSIVECTSVMIADDEIQNFYDSGISVPRPEDTHLKALLHYNINVSDFEASKKFYKLLAFANFIDQNINVTDPEEAQGLGLPPYSLKATPMRAKDGFIIDLIKFNSPYDDEAPHKDYNSIGFSSLHLKSSNLKKDRAYLARNGVSSTVIVGTEEAPEKIQFADPDGTTILMSQVGPISHVYFFQRTKIDGVFSTNINVTNLNRSVDFYTEVGFQLIDRNDSYATIALSKGRHITLTESCSSNMAYEQVNHLGIARIALTTSNLEADMEILKAKGIEFYTPQPVQGTGLFSIIKFAAFEDPDGNVLELVKLPF